MTVLTLVYSHGSLPSCESNVNALRQDIATGTSAPNQSICIGSAALGPITFSFGKRGAAPDNSASRCPLRPFWNALIGPQRRSGKWSVNFAAAGPRSWTFIPARSTASVPSAAGELARRSSAECQPAAVVPIGNRQFSERMKRRWLIARHKRETYRNYPFAPVVRI